ncbi:uncharacterized protein [Parasteatoda tepidariorum]|uniref:uncharacterized protein n=1 Tax=Parasteatoda tepidariorum TaxID=114398 RepID=UPI001C72607B|nr:uncharacterized protein LOC122272162 [Parasteatoda tepidariorum]
MRVIERQLQLAVNKILDWCDHNGHTLSPSKSSCIHFCRKRTLHNDPVISIHNITIPVVPYTKFLGVIFDSKLTFRPHIVYLRKRCEQILNMLRVLSNTFWGADRLALLRIYQALKLSRLDYACAVYGTATTSNLRALDTVHHAALRISSGAFRTSPVESLYVVCQQIPLHLRRMQLSLTYYFSVMSSKSHPLKHDAISSSLERLYLARPSHIRPFHARTRSLIQTFDICELPSQSVDHFLIPPWTISPYQCISLFKFYNKANVTPGVFHKIFTAHRHQYSQYIPIFTDGSKSVGYVGCGVIIADDTFSYKIPHICSVFTAEAVAILMALRLISSNSTRKYCLYSDSMSVLSQPEKFHYDSHPILCIIIHLLITLQKNGFEIIFCWVPSHVGIPGNERADSAARSATSALSLSIPFADVKIHIRKFVTSVWQQQWDLKVLNKLHNIKSVGANLPTLKRKNCMHAWRCMMQLAYRWVLADIPMQTMFQSFREEEMSDGQTQMRRNSIIHLGICVF